jgi:LmbE family N-acetylglucosaminyl deacetylase
MNAQAAFDTAQPGTPLQQWTSWADRWPVWEPVRARLLVVAPHPDDETLAAGGLIYTWCVRKWPVTIVLVTDGEAACPEIPRLAQRRVAELRASLQCLQARSIEVVRLGLPDGRVREHEGALIGHIAACLQPDSLIVAPFEADGHPDHDSAGRAALTAARARDLPVLRYPVWACYRGPAELWMQSRGVRLLLDEHAWEAKRRAVAEFRTQLTEREGGPIVPPHVLAYFQQQCEVFLLDSQAPGRYAAGSTDGERRG